MNTTFYQEEDANPDANAEEQEKNQDRNEQPLFLRGDSTFFQIFLFCQILWAEPIAHIGQTQIRTEVIDCLYWVSLFNLIDCFTNENYIFYCSWSLCLK